MKNICLSTLTEDHILQQVFEDNRAVEPTQTKLYSFYVKSPKMNDYQLLVHEQIVLESSLQVSFRNQGHRGNLEHQVLRSSSQR